MAEKKVQFPGMGIPEYRIPYIEGSEPRTYEEKHTKIIRCPDCSAILVLVSDNDEIPKDIEVKFVKHVT